VAPEIRRTVVNVAASIAESPSASRQKIELAANAVRANAVQKRVFRRMRNSFRLFLGYPRDHSIVLTA